MGRAVGDAYNAPSICPRAGRVPTQPFSETQPVTDPMSVIGWGALREGGTNTDTLQVRGGWTNSMQIRSMEHLRPSIPNQQKR